MVCTQSNFVLLALGKARPAVSPSGAGSGGPGSCGRRGPIAVACNLADRAQAVPVGGPGRVLLASDPGVPPAAGGVELPPDSAAVLEVDGEGRR
jgi:hypothetical protein